MVRPRKVRPSNGDHPALEMMSARSTLQVAFGSMRTRSASAPTRMAPLAGSEAVALGGDGGATEGDLVQGEHATQRGIDHERVGGVEPGEPEGRLPDVACHLLLDGGRSVVGGDVGERPIPQGPPHLVALVVVAAASRRGELAERPLVEHFGLVQRQILRTRLGGGICPQLRAVCTTSTASRWLTWAKVMAAPVAAASAPTMVSAESSALRLRHSTSRPGSCRPARRSDHSAMDVIVSSSQCTNARPSTAANAVSAPSNSEAESPGTPWVVQVNSLKKTTPARHSSGMPAMSSGQTWAASP